MRMCFLDCTVNSITITIAYSLSHCLGKIMQVVQVGSLHDQRKVSLKASRGQWAKTANLETDALATPQENDDGKE